MQPHRRQPTRLLSPGILQARELEWAAISFSNGGQGTPETGGPWSWPHSLGSRALGRVQQPGWGVKRIPTPGPVTGCSRGGRLRRTQTRVQQPNLLWLVSLQDRPRGERLGNRDRAGRVTRELMRTEPAKGARVLGGAEGMPGASGGQLPTVTLASESLRAQGTACRGPMGAPWGTAPSVGMWVPLGGQPTCGGTLGNSPPVGMWVPLGEQPPCGYVGDRKSVV